MANLNMDLTGTQQEFACTNEIYRVFKYGQVIDFETPVFLDTIKVYLISSGLSDTELEYLTDYIVPDEYVTSCDNHMSSAKIMNPTFDKTLVSGIQMIRGVTTEDTYTVAISYQKLYPNQLKQAYYNGTPVTFTPELLMSMVQSISKLEILNSGVSDSTSITSDPSIILEADVDKSLDSNYITDEEHAVDVAGGDFVIIPQCGSFYYDSVSIKLQSGYELVNGTDYTIVGMDEARTKVTTHTSPVYQYIVLTTPVVGTVYVSYHAFGGAPTVENYRELLAGLTNVVNYLNEANTLSESTLGSSEVMVSVIDRINSLESGMRRLMNTPSYGDATSGKSTRMKLYSSTQGLHWYTIASLYTIIGDTTPSTADTFIFRLQSEQSHFQWQVAVSVDLSNISGDIMAVNIISDNYPRGYIPFQDYGDIESIIRPQLRVVWTEGDNLSGAYLQLGMSLTDMNVETVAIEDMSGQESAWKLVDEITTYTSPSDDNFTLPNSDVSWSSSLSTCKQESTLIPFKNGHLVWAGSQPMNYPYDGWQYFTVNEEILLESETDLRRIRCLRVDIEETDGLQFAVDIGFSSGTSHLLGHGSFVYQNQPAYVNAEIYYNSTGAIEIRLNYDVQAGTASNALNIRDMVIFL